MLKKTKYSILIILISILASSCSEYQKVLRSDDPEKKYEKAIEYYQKGDYFRSMQLFDELVIIYRGTSKVEKIYYYYAYSYYGQGDYYMAAYHFQNLAKTIPNSKYAEESSFMSAYCKFLQSPKPSLDQEMTKRAINEFQLFINRYPESERVDTCNQLMDKLRYKIETKTYLTAYNYYKTRDYKSAIYALEHFAKEYPESEYKEKALYYRVKASYEYAANSIATKQKERFEDTIQAYEKFVFLYPESNYLKDIISIKNNADKQIDKITQS